MLRLKFVYCVWFVVVVTEKLFYMYYNFKTYAINTGQTNGAKIIIIITIFKIKADPKDVQIFACWLCAAVWVCGGVNVALWCVCGCKCVRVCCDMLIANSLKQLRLHAAWELSHYEHIQMRVYLYTYIYHSVSALYSIYCCLARRVSSLACMHCIYMQIKPLPV